MVKQMYRKQQSTEAELDKSHARTEASELYVYRSKSSVLNSGLAVSSVTNYNFFFQNCCEMAVAVVLCFTHVRNTVKDGFFKY